MVLWAAASALVPQMQKGNDNARNAHIALNTLNLLLFAWQVGLISTLPSIVNDFGASEDVMLERLLHLSCRRCCSHHFVFWAGVKVGVPRTGAYWLGDCGEGVAIRTVAMNVCKIHGSACNCLLPSCSQDRRGGCLC